MSFEETELRLGLPGNGRLGTGSDQYQGEMVRKRGFYETKTVTMVDLKLNLSSKEANGGLDPNDQNLKNLYKETTVLTADPAKPPAPKAQVVGWPPIRSYRKNTLALQKGTANQESDEKGMGGNAAFVKVSLDGAPYLRKVDLTIYNSYKQLSDALAKLFGSFTIGNYGSQAAGMKDFMNESKLIDLLNGSDYVPTYQDKDGDWMLVGDVPWQMFVESCKRLRIMKGKEAIGLAPRAIEKCKNYKC